MGAGSQRSRLSLWPPQVKPGGAGQVACVTMWHPCSLARARRGPSPSLSSSTDAMARRQCVGLGCSLAGAACTGLTACSFWVIRRRELACRCSPGAHRPLVAPGCPRARDVHGSAVAAVVERRAPRAVGTQRTSVHESGIQPGGGQFYYRGIESRQPTNRVHVCLVSSLPRAAPAQKHALPARGCNGRDEACNLHQVGEQCRTRLTWE